MTKITMPTPDGAIVKLTPADARSLRLAPGDSALVVATDGTTWIGVALTSEVVRIRFVYDRDVGRSVVVRRPLARAA